jgi:phosphoglycolate phosphatase-like HAD superfamily hydrolase
MAGYGLLIFDLDGTLFQTETVTIPAVRQSFWAQGLPVPTTEEICSFFGKPGSEFHAWLASRCPQDKTSELMAAIDRTELELISQTGELYPQIQEVLATLRASVGQMAVCSNGPQTYVERVLAVHGLRLFFDAVKYRRSDQDTKPGMIRELLEHLASRPAIVIGDRRDDIEAAHQNGLKVISATYGYGWVEELGSADAAASSPSELPRLVRTLLELPPRKL